MIDDLNKANEEPIENEINDNGIDSNNQSNNDEAKSASENETEVLKNQLSEANDKFLRLYAEFDNYKRRTIKEKSEILQTAGKDVMLSLLPVIDDFERAMKANENVNDVQLIKEGISLIHNKFFTILQNKGLKAVDSIGQAFNTDVHEAITNIPSPSEDMIGKVIDETEKGYTLNGHVIRFAKVIVGE